LDELEKFVNSPKRIEGKTSTDIGKGLDNAVTALIDEGDFRQERAEDLIRDRCSRNLARQVLHTPPDQRVVLIYNFGATIIHKREPFRDTATRNRTVTIKTQRRSGTYKVTDVNTDGVKAVADIVRKANLNMATSDRVSDTWRPLTIIAATCQDKDWLRYELTEMDRATRTLAMGDQYEPEDVLLKAVIASSVKGLNRATKLIDIRKTLSEHFDLKWSTQRIHAMLSDLGFEVTFYAGYDRLKANEELVMRLAKERGIDSTPPPELQTLV
jgi:hypothetical protein